MELDLANERQRLAEVFAGGALADTAMARQFQQMLNGAMPTAHLADVLAFNLIENVQLKQQLLAEGDVARRVARVTMALEELRPMLEAGAQRQSRAGVMN